MIALQVLDPPECFSRMTEKAGSRRWLDRVEQLMRTASLATTQRALMLLIDNLARELLLAPSEEDCAWLLSHLMILKEKLLALGHAVQLPVRAAVASA